MVDRKAFRSLSYGLYVVSSLLDSAQAGCVVNTFAQVTSTPAQVSVALNKDNHTTQAVIASGAYEVSVLDETAPMELIGTFGFHSSKDTDKFAPYAWEESEQGLPYLAQNVCAHFSVKVTNQLDLGSHILFIGKVVEAGVFSDKPAMTYAYYHDVKGGKTPPKASSYNGGETDAPSGTAPAPAPADVAAPAPAPADVAAPAPTSAAPAASAGNAFTAASVAPAAPSGTPRYAWRCTVCGHIEYVDELPDDFICPICGVGKDMFERIVVE